MKRIIALSLTALLVLAVASCLPKHKEATLRFLAEGARIVDLLEVFEIIGLDTALEWHRFLAENEATIRDLPENVAEVKAYVKERLAQWLDELHAQGKLPDPEYDYLVARLARW